jgi:hypothetical protein
MGIQEAYDVMQTLKVVLWYCSAGPFILILLSRHLVFKNKCNLDFAIENGRDGVEHGGLQRDVVYLG